MADEFSLTKQDEINLRSLLDQPQSQGAPIILSGMLARLSRHLPISNVRIPLSRIAVTTNPLHWRDLTLYVVPPIYIKDS
jgi:hypothetical protein